MTTDEKKWKRYRFHTKSVDDWRPLIYNPQYPCWCSGYAGDESYAVVIAFLPVDEDLYKYWDDAYNIEYTEEDQVTFSSRFPKPQSYKEEEV